MSSVRMCDRCGNIFSERADGWETYIGTRVTRGKNGRQTTTTEQMDACPSCAMNAEIPQPALRAGVDNIADTLPVGHAEDETRAAAGDPF